MRIINRLILTGSVLFVTAAATLGAETRGDAITVHRLVLPDGQTLVCQASDLHAGRIGQREGLWLVCDRNSGSSGNRILWIDRKRLDNAQPDEPLRISEAFPIQPPLQGWPAFNAKHAGLGEDVLTTLRAQLENGTRQARPILDLEAITVGRSPDSDEDHLFVAAEQPHSLVLELVLKDKTAPAAVLVAAYRYMERDNERGEDINDGIEGLCWTGKPGVFFLAEEGTRAYRPGDKRHFFDRPRLIRATLHNGRVIPDEPWSSAATASVGRFEDKGTHTLNGLALPAPETLLAVDRNGGWLLAVDTHNGRTTRWLNLYDPAGLDLRHRLDRFPALRHMPYVSIEGLAIDARGDLWLIDDPAMPEGFRESCLIRMKNPPAWPEPDSGPTTRPLRPGS